jgi:hypothetical protein
MNLLRMRPPKHAESSAGSTTVALVHVLQRPRAEACGEAASAVPSCLSVAKLQQAAEQGGEDPVSYTARVSVKALQRGRVPAR